MRLVALVWLLMATTKLDLRTDLALLLLSSRGLRHRSPNEAAVNGRVRRHDLDNATHLRNRLSFYATKRRFHPW